MILTHWSRAHETDTAYPTFLLLNEGESTQAARLSFTVEKLKRDALADLSELAVDVDPSKDVVAFYERIRGDMTDLAEEADPDPTKAALNKVLGVEA